MQRFSAPRSRNHWLKGLAPIKFSAKKYKNLGKYAIVIVGLFLGVGLLIFIISEFWQGLKYSVWDGESQLTLAFENNNHLGYIKFNKQLNEVLIINFPDNLLLRLADGYQDYRADKVKYLSYQEKIDFGELLSESLTQFLGNVTDGYLVNLREDETQVSDFLVQTLLKRSETNLSDWDILRLLMFTQSLRLDQIKVLDLNKTRFLELTQLPDKTEIYMISQPVFDDFILKELANPKFLKEDLTWEIFNGTDHFGLGEMTRRIVANSGFDVVGVRQAPENYQKSKILVSREEINTVSINKFASYLDFPVEFANSGGSRADVTVIIGEDYWQKCCQK